MTKVFLITLSISALVLIGVWILPNILSGIPASAPISTHEHAYIELETMSFQALVTWIIGSINGIFGMILLIKKVFSKPKP